MTMVRLVGRCYPGGHADVCKFHCLFIVLSILSLSLSCQVHVRLGASPFRADGKATPVAVQGKLPCKEHCKENYYTQHRVYGTLRDRFGRFTPTTTPGMCFT